MTFESKRVLREIMFCVCEMTIVIYIYLIGVGDGMGYERNDTGYDWKRWRSEAVAVELKRRVARASSSGTR